MINCKSPKVTLGLFDAMKIDIIELKWGYFEYIQNRKKEELLTLVRYKDKNEALQEFLEASQKYHVTLEYYINGFAYSDYLHSLFGSRVLEPHILGFFFNTLSINIRPKSYAFDKNYAWEKIVLKKLLLKPIMIEDIELCYPHLKKTPDLLQKEFEEEQNDRVFIYGCACKDKMCRGEVIIVNSTEDTVSWDIRIRNHRKYIFDKKQYFEAFAEIKEYIFSK